MQEPVLLEIRAAIARLLPAGVIASAGAIADAVALLKPAELAPTARMSARRLQEYSAGRGHARKALERLGLRSPAIAVGPDRAPLWPAGFVGSISHAGDLVLAVAAPSSLIRGIGIDLEPALPLDADLVHRVCRPGELAALAPAVASSQRGKLIFSAKESVYKCIAPLTGVFLEFEDVELLFDTGGNRFRARGRGPAAGLIAPATLTGAFAEAGGYWVTAAWQRSRPDPDQD
ncbi:MAG: 4'-phosphopantetheinyl transferase superfamily protein [Chromatiales bacterium]|nr:4'-phosphopantetheinyl transferase superfamily protein [Chromatiales bacterium]